MKFQVNNNEVYASTGGRPFDKDKPLIIFVHGSGLTHMTWVLQTRYFAFHGYSVLACLLYTSPSPRDNPASRMPSSA